MVCLTGLIAMLADLSDPSAIGAGMAVALLSTLYGAFLAEFIFAPCRQTLVNHLENRLDSEDHNMPSNLPKNHGSDLWRGATLVLLILCCFFVLTVSFSEINKEKQFEAVMQHVEDAFTQPTSATPIQE